MIVIIKLIFKKIFQFNNHFGSAYGVTMLIRERKHSSEKYTTEVDL